MQAALRLARHRALLPRSVAVRSLATTVTPSHAASSTTASSSTSSQSIIPLSNIEAQWANMTSEEQLTVHQQLEVLQKKDWKNLSIDEKKAAYYVAFGPHGPRTPHSPAGQGLKVFIGVLSLVSLSGAIVLFFRSIAPPPPRTITKEWQEASNERALEQKMNPITGIASEGYAGKGFVTEK